MGKGTKYALYAGVFALVAVLLAIFLGGVASSLGAAGVSLFSILGIGFWLYVIGAIGLIAAGLLKK